MEKQKIEIICPFCGGEGRQYQSTIIKILYPLLFLDKKYICKKCKAMFNKSHKSGDSQMKKENNRVINIVKAIIIIIFIWILYSFISVAI